jgi:ABC-type maltose transport system permease subunit
MAINSELLELEKLRAEIAKFKSDIEEAAYRKMNLERQAHNWEQQELFWKHLTERQGHNWEQQELFWAEMTKQGSFANRLRHTTIVASITTSIIVAIIGGLAIIFSKLNVSL